MNKIRKSNLFVFVVSVLSVLFMASFVRPSSNTVEAYSEAPSASPVAVVIDAADDYGQHAPRPNACRTYLWGGYDMADGVVCKGAAPKAVSFEPESTVVVAPPATVVVVAPPVVVVDTPVQENTCTNANPGNTKCKGQAGEDPNGKGTMPEDNTGGNGNGQHGNQGKGKK